MLDLKWIRENPELVRKGLAAKNISFDLEKLLDLDTRRRTLLREVEQLKSRRNQANDEIAHLKKDGKLKEAEAAIANIKSISQKIHEIDQEVEDTESSLEGLIYNIPNLPHSDVPTSAGPEGNKVIREWGEKKSFNFNSKDHLELGSSLGWVSMEAGSRITGTAFPVYRGEGARLERALINLMLDIHTKRHGYEEVWPPALVNRQSMTGTGQLPGFEEDMYRLRDDDYFLVPTAEVPLTNLHRDEVLEEEVLPIKYVAYTPCFRREAGSYGKDTRGLSRVHQFDKVELVKFVKPEDGLSELESLVKDAEAILRLLEMSYRVVLLSSGDLSFAGAKCYDLEVWAPATKKWFEVSSCSWFGDFQARRIHIRFRRKDTKKLEYVHTLNGSGVALARTVLCLLENFQTPGGKIELPKILKDYVS